ncbi:MAG: N-formylglutamate amidohydrolase [Clostridia bacterium]|nr:N-formylglutamate amidohydrolase [Clostridia bacterium]
MNKILLHIPHFATKVPKFFWKDVCVKKEIINQFINDITDTDTNKLFGANKYEKIQFGFSRVFCDVEKFADDSVETMSKFGMGVVYNKTNHGVQFRQVNEDYKQYILDNYYYPYHNQLDAKVQNMLNDENKVIIIDCHSFSKDIIMFDKKKNNLPDICIGFNGTMDKLSKLAVDYFSKLGYNVKTNYPYDGSIIPNSILKKPNKNILSVMLEINKEIYLYNKDRLKKLKNEINEFLKFIEKNKFD